MQVTFARNHFQLELNGNFHHWNSSFYSSESTLNSQRRQNVQSVECMFMCARPKHFYIWDTNYWFYLQIVNAADVIFMFRSYRIVRIICMVRVCQKHLDWQRQQQQDRPAHQQYQQQHLQHQIMQQRAQVVRLLSFPKHRHHSHHQHCIRHYSIKVNHFRHV